MRSEIDFQRRVKWEMRLWESLAAASTLANGVVETSLGSRRGPGTVYLWHFLVSWPWKNLMYLGIPGLSSRGVTSALTIPPRSLWHSRGRWTWKYADSIPSVIQGCVSFESAPKILRRVLADSPMERIRGKENLERKICLLTAPRKLSFLVSST